MQLTEEAIAEALATMEEQFSFSLRAWVGQAVFLVCVAAGAVLSYLVVGNALLQGFTAADLSGP